VRHPGTAKGPKRTAKALPCVDARQRAHGSVANGNALFAVRRAAHARQRTLPCVAIVAVGCCLFAVRLDFAVGLHRCRAWRLCHALLPFAVHACIAERRGVAVPPLCRASSASFAVRRVSSPHGKATRATHQPAPSRTTRVLRGVVELSERCDHPVGTHAITL
jgi:hypothetical protein